MQHYRIRVCLMYNLYIRQRVLETFSGSGCGSS